MNGRDVAADVKQPVCEAEDDGSPDQSGQRPALPEKSQGEAEDDGGDDQQSGGTVPVGQAPAELESGDHADCSAEKNE
ncbi:hypothetical protein GCM10009540_85890 [Streptomyces turgidiscabies]